MRLFSFDPFNIDELQKEIYGVFGKDAVDNYYDALDNLYKSFEEKTKKGVSNVREAVKDCARTHTETFRYVDGENSKYTTSFDKKDDKLIFTIELEYKDNFGCETKSFRVQEIPANCIVEQMKTSYNEKNHTISFIFPRDWKCKEKVEKIQKKATQTIEDVKDKIKDNIDGVSDAVIERIANRVYQKMKEDESKNK